MEIIILNGARMTDRETAHAYLKERLGLPEYYGCNLDALADCLSEFGGNREIMLVNSEEMKESLGFYGDMLIHVFEELAEAEYIAFKHDGTQEEEE